MNLVHRRLTVGLLLAFSLFVDVASAQEPTQLDNDPPLPPVYLAWYGETGAEWTVVFMESDGGIERLDEWPGIHIAHGDRIWRIDDQPYWRATVNCGCIMWEEDHGRFAEATDECRYRTLGQVPILQSLTDDESRELVSRLPDSSEYEMDQAFEVLASIGPRLFIRHGTYGYACGAAHGDSDADFSVYDLRSDAAWSLSEVLDGNDELVSDIENTRASAMEAFEPDLLFTDDPSELEPTMLFPDFGAEDVEWNVQWTGGACYACSDHLWSAYTSSVRVVVATDANVLDAPSHVPPAVRHLQATMNNSEVRGWSRIEPESQAHPLLLDGPR